MVVSVGILGVCAGFSWLWAIGHVLGLRVLFRYDITSMSQNVVLEIFQEALALTVVVKGGGPGAVRGHQT